MKRGAISSHILAAALILSGCGGTPGGAGIGSRILQELAKSHGTQFLIETVKWTVLGALGGLLLAVVLFLVLRKLGAFRWEWRHAKWFRWLTLAWLLIATPFCTGTVGFFEGMWRGSRIVLHESHLGVDVFPKIGDAASLCLAYLHLLVPRLDSDANGRAGEFPKTELEAFQAGAWELDVPEFQRRLDRITAETMAKATTKLKNAALEEYPSLRGGVGETVINWFVDKLGGTLVKEGVEQVDRFGVQKRFAAVLDALPAEAARAGAPSTIAHKELSAYLVKQALVPCIELPIRSVVRSQQSGAWLMLAVVVVIPILCFQVAEFVRRRMGKQEVPETLPDPQKHPKSASD